jgi:folylpolyglutamate synthase/dihydropteroate synthase
VAETLDLLDPSIPLLSVVGSKGKGTAATYAAATLTSAGIRTVLVTSPSFIDNTERIRVDGERVDDAAMDELGRRITEARSAVHGPDTGYLSPTGSFTLAGILHAKLSGAGAVVLEEGLGGASDEISLFPPDVLAVTRVFLEHQDLLGADVTTIARDLLGVIGQRTRGIVTIAQDDDVNAVLQDLSVPVDVVPGHLGDVPFGIDGVLWPAALSRQNALLGISAAAMLLGRSEVAAIADLTETLNTVRLPGRLSTHRTEDGATWVIDAAISPDGVAAALRHCRDTGFRPDAILASFPDGKDVAGCYAELSGWTVIPVAAASAHLRYTPSLHPRNPTTLEKAVRELPHGHHNILALGTISFVGEVLDHVGADMRHLYRKVARDDDAA